MTTYRYTWKGIDADDVAKLLDPSLVVSVLGPAPAPVIDVVLNSSSATDKDDLDAAMFQKGWLYFSTDPPAQPQGIILRQEIPAKLLSDSSTTSDTFADLIVVPITTGAGVLGLIASAVSTAIVTPGYFRITVDGVTVANGAHGVGMMNMFLGVRILVPAAAHTVKLQWRTDATGTHKIDASSMPEAEFASLLVRELSG